MKDQMALNSLARRSAMGLAAMILLSFVPRASAQVGPLPYADDHFLCYRGGLSTGSTSAASDQSISLVDAFESGSFTLGKERGSCNPADKNGEGIVNAGIHLTSYQIKAIKGAPKHSKKLNQRVFNQFGDVYVDTIKPDHILVPAKKDDNPANPLPTPPVNASHNVEHYKCYKIKVSKGTPKFPRGVQATVEDQWETPAKLYDLKKPKMLCLPVNKNGEGIKHSYANQLCYQVRPAKGEAKHTPRADVGFADQFIAHRLDSKKEELLCVPSLLNPPAEFCGDGVINQGGLEECEGDDADCASNEICLDSCHCVATAARCGNGILEPEHGESCELDTDCAVGEACTTSCACMDAQCPDTLVMTRFSGVGSKVTVSDNDSGWTGVAHDSGIPDLQVHHYRLGAVTGSGPNACGVATIVGLDPSSRLCRCDNDNRQVCDQPGELDFDDCGGNTCTCYLDAPIGSVSGNIPTCSLTEFAGDVTGTWNVDTGAGELQLALEQTTKLTAGGGVALFKPCPSCDGDITLNDGVRDGTCNGGINDGLPCDAQQNDPTFPAPGGSGSSLDCYPGGPTVVNGLFVEINYTTGTRQLDAQLPCLAGTDLCHCGGCLGNYNRQCSTNADCGDEGPCGVNDAGNPAPNACGDLTCTDLGEGQGYCATDAPEQYCDAVVRADGTGLIGCNSNADCAALPVPAGNCTLLEQPPCYPDSINVNGLADTVEPVLVAADCIARSPINPGANLVAGYPGPGVRHEQLEIDLPCVGNPAFSYPSCP